MDERSSLAGGRDLLVVGTDFDGDGSGDVFVG